MATTTVGRDIVPTSLAVKAMRDNGYKNAAYAVAELIDNSIQAKAKMVELLCADKRSLVAERERESLDQLAVLDNGSGMEAETLEIALQFGNGSRLEKGKAEGMGRFGMGLPSASISQCRRVEVWTWQDGPEKALYSYIDLDEIDAGSLDEVPVPVKKEIPELWRQTASEKAFGKAGTLVVWSNIDRVMWRTSRALIDNSQELIGRMYREWIDAKKVTIRMAKFVNARPEEIEEKNALPNDPTYLMKDTSCPDPYDHKAMFKPFPSKDSYEMKPKIRFRGKEHEVTLRFSIATEEARNPDGAGNLPYGRHAGRNTGVSVVRAGRELELDLSWTNTYDPRERWWGVEVRFEPGLDELFGVSNNKQFARNFSEAAQIDVKALARDHGGSVSRLRDFLEKDEDPLAPLIEVISRVQTNIAEMRKIITSQAAGKRRRRHEASVEQQATEAVDRRKKEGHKGASDTVEEEESAKDRKAEIADTLEDLGHDKKEAKSLAGETIDKGLKYRIETSTLEGGAFFSVTTKGGVLLVTLNNEHPAFEMLLGAGRGDEELPTDPKELKTRLQAAQDGLEMMLLAWARYEDEQPPDQRRQTQDIRIDWGRIAESFLRAQTGS